MSRQPVKKLKSRHKMAMPKIASAETVSQIDAQGQALRERYFEFFLMALLLAFGTYQSVLYFGYKLVPNPDFPAFFKTGQELLSFRIPSSFNRAPVLGILQVLLSYIVGGQHPNLTAGWLLNAILHPFNVVLFYLVGKKIIGKAALWFAIIAIINYWVIYLLTEPLAETTLLFFILLTVYFIFRRSNYSYLFASITTMVRYEGAALILAAFVMDMICRKSRQERLRAFAYSILASVPLGIWLVGNFAKWEGGSYLQLFGKEYSKLYVEPEKYRTGVIRHLGVLWRTAFYPLLSPYPGASEESIQMLWKLSELIAFAGFFFGSIYGLCKRRWEILVLLLFFVPYFAVHTKFPSPLLRYHMPIFWIAILLCLFGLQSAWKLIDRGGRMPRALVAILQAIVAIISAVWLVSLVSYLPKISSVSPRSVWLPYVGMALAAIIFAVRLYIYKLRFILRELSILALVCLVIVSNQFPLVRLLGDGQQDKEFMQLADWFVTNAKPGEKMGVYMACVVQIFAPEYTDRIVPLPAADSPQDFIKTCYQQNITYVAWATREGLSTDHTGYRQLRLNENIKQLATPKSQGAYQFVGQVGSERGYVNIFRLRPPKPEPDIK